MSTLVYRGDYSLRLVRAIWFSDGIRPVFNPRGEFVEHEQLRRWEVSIQRGPILRAAGSRSFSRAVFKAICLVYRARFFPKIDEAAHRRALRRNLAAVAAFRACQRCGE